MRNNEKALEEISGRSDCYVRSSAIAVARVEVALTYRNPKSGLARKSSGKNILD